ncbi:MAG: hypothetical protein AB1649_12130, partial [Chloroflexota bacterium]
VAPFVSPFSNASILSTSYLGYGWLMVVSIRAPDGVEGKYYVVWDGEIFKCSIPEQRPDQLDCIVALIPPWKKTTIEVYPVESETSVFQFVCVYLAPRTHPEKLPPAEWICREVD